MNIGKIIIKKVNLKMSNNSHDNILFFSRIINLKRRFRTIIKRYINSNKCDDTDNADNIIWLYRALLTY